MAKVPIAGLVKTRLSPNLSPQQSAELAECFLKDTISKAKSLKNRLIIAYSPIEKRSYFDCFTNCDLTLVAQTGNCLGERIFNAFAFAFESRLDYILMIGTDSPTFPGKLLTKGFEILEENDAVLGKTEDGGFYLIGLRRLDERIFENVDWSSEKTFVQTKNNLQNLNFSLGELPVWYDIDEPKDLERLRQDEILHEFAPVTADWLKRQF